MKSDEREMSAVTALQTVGTLEAPEPIDTHVQAESECVEPMSDAALTASLTASGQSETPSPLREFLNGTFRYANEPRRLYKERIRREYQHHPEAYWLYLLKWRFIGCFTFQRPKLPAHVRTDAFIGALRDTYKYHRLYFGKALWFRCYELGSRKDLTPHIHFLIAGIPQRISPIVFTASLKRSWKTRGGGTAWVEKYNPLLSGGTYCAKRSPLAFGEHSWEDCDPTFSDAALQTLQRRQREMGIQHPDSSI